MDLEPGSPGSYQGSPGSGRGARPLPRTITSPAVIFKYNPHQMTAESLLGTFVGRDELLSRMIAHLRRQRGAGEPKHFFLYGPRGIGKTTMLLVLRHKVAANPGLSAAFDVVQFSEEERRVANLPSFAIRALELLAEVRPAVEPDLAAARDEPERALEMLLAAGGRDGDRQVLFLLDNFDDLAIAAVSGKSKRFDKEEAVGAMERFLTCPHFVVVATALQSPVKNKRFPKPLREAFDPIIELDPLSDAMRFLRKRAQQDHRQGFLESLPRLASRIDGMNRLAAGNPRLLVFLYDCLGDRPLPDLVEIVQRTVDELTPMYQDVIDRLLNRGQAAVLEMLVVNGGVGRAKKIAELTYQDEQTVRTFLGNLCDLGLVIRADGLGLPGHEREGSGRETVYRIHPPLFQIWYEMRHLGRERGLFLVRFFSLLTDPAEVRGILSELERPAVTARDASLTRLMADVVEVLDPEWEEIKKKYVDELLASGRTLRDSRAALDRAIAEGEAEGRIGLLVVRSEVNRCLGDLKGAGEDLSAAAETVATRGTPESQAKLETAWSRFHSAAGDYHCAVARAQRAVELCAGLAGTSARQIHAGALLALAFARKGLSEHRLALRTAQRALELPGNEGSLRLRGCVTNLIGVLHQSLANYADAREWHAKSLAMARDSGDRQGEASSLGNLGTVHQSLGAYDQAREYYEKALAIRQKIADRAREATSLNDLGNVYYLSGAYDQAREYWEKALAIGQKIGDRLGEATSLDNLGTVHRSLGAYDQAREYHERALEISRETGDRAGEAASLNNLGNAYWSLRVYDQARECCERAVLIAQEIGDRAGEALVLGTLGTVLLAEGRPDEALNFFQKAHALFRAIGQWPYIKQSAAYQARCILQLASADFRSAQKQSAQRLFNQTLALVDDVEPGELLALVVNHLIVPCLQHSRNLAPQLAPLVTWLKKNKGFRGFEGALSGLEALLGHYSPDSAGTAINDLGPVEMSTVQELVDRIERPQHVEARRLLLAGKAAEAQEVLESIVEKSPADLEALLDLASARIAQGALDEAQRTLNEVLAQQKDFSPARLLLAQIEQRRNRPDRAIEILQDLIGHDPSFREAYPPLEPLLRRQKRFEELAAILTSWRATAEDAGERRRLDVWIAEAYVLAGELNRAGAATPLDPPGPDDPETRLLHGLLRVLLALHEMDAEAARCEAASVLELAAELPPGQVPSPLSRDLAARAAELLGDEESQFFLALAGAITQNVDPLEFADQYLSSAELDELRRRLAEEGRLAVEALRGGRIQVLRDLFRTSTRSIGPPAGLAAFGDAYAELAPAQREVLTHLFTEALAHGRPGEVRAALGALGKNFPHLEPPQRSRSLAAILDLAGRTENGDPSREQALRVLNVLYPNLPAAERRQVRERLEAIRQEIASPTLAEFFRETVPAVSATDHKEVRQP